MSLVNKFSSSNICQDMLCDISYPCNKCVDKLVCDDCDNWSSQCICSGTSKCFVCCMNRVKGEKKYPICLECLSNVACVVCSQVRSECIENNTEESNNLAMVIFFGGIGYCSCSDEEGDCERE